jgi:GT2 family glycosyltransferase
MIWSPANSQGTAVIIATRGRPDIVQGLVRLLAGQSQPPDHVFVIATRSDDISGLEDSQRLTVRIGRPGSAMQRNDGLVLAGSRFAHIVFFDDDFVPSRFWIERMTDVFASRSDISGLTGTVLADGASTRGIAPSEAEAIVSERDAQETSNGAVHNRVGYGGNIGCNMAFRYAAIADVTFDEHLPAYAWLEDADFHGQAARHGPFVHVDALWGVHLGHKQGRSRGVPLGYSQMANAAYLARKGTVPRSYLARLATKNLLSNTVRSVRPEPFVDRRGRLFGNVLALADLARGRITPERVLDL